MSVRLADRRVPWDADAESVPAALFATIVGPDGLIGSDDALFSEALAAECGAALELVRLSPM
jgi:hypothetical protein